MKSLDIDYYFGRLDGGMKRGRDVLTSDFAYTDDPVITLIREALQNVSGARSEKTARVEIDLLNMPTSDVPHHSKLSHLMEMCAAALSGAGALKDATPFQNVSHRLAAAQSIPVVRISDFGTTGLTADRWNRLAGWIGMNPGTGNEPGSYGLGRGAFFAASRCSTVFYSSKAKDGYRFAGKSYLPSFEVDGEWRQGDGTYGHTGQMPVSNPNLIPDYFKRTKQGTSIWILDFDTNGDVEERMVRATLVYFWPAIKSGILEVRIGSQNINAKNLREVMCNFYSTQDKNTHQNPNPLHFLDAYEIPSEEVIAETAKILGHIEYRAKTSSEQPYSGMTAYLRDTGMIIYFTKKNSPIKFTGVFVCRNEAGSTILRKMENPTHTKWVPSYWKDNDRQIVQTGKDAKEELDSFVSRAINKVTSQGTGGRFDMDSVAGVDETDPESNSRWNEGDSEREVKAVVEETGIEIGAENTDSLASTHVIKAVSVPRVKTNRTDEPVDDGEVINISSTEDGGTGTATYDVDSNGQNVGSIEIEDLTTRCYEESQEDGKPLYRVIIRTGKKYAGRKIGVFLRAFTDEGSSINTAVISCKDSRKGGDAAVSGTGIRVTLDTKGASEFSVSLAESFLVAPAVTARLVIA